MAKIHEKHSLGLRLLHWFNVPLLCMMIWSGIVIYWAHEAYPGFFPEWFYALFHMNGRLAEGMAIHFLIGWLFVINGLVYLIWLLASGHWRELFPDRHTPARLLPTVLHDLGLTKQAPPQGMFNAAQRVAYTGAIVLGIVGVLSGFAIYKPVQLQWLTNVFGGYEGARLVHFIVMISFCLFIGLHLLQVIRAGWNGFRAMVAGFEVEDER